MHVRLKILFAALLASIGLHSFGAQFQLNSAPAAPTAHTQAKLLLDATIARPGDTVTAGVALHMDEHWHTYWRNPGDSGSPTKIEWQLPPGVTAGETQWPLPKKLTVAGLTTYVYENDVMLLVPLTLASNLPAGPLELKAKVSWLECAEICVPGKQDVNATLNVGSETKISADAATIEPWKTSVPKPPRGWWVSASWEEPSHGDTRQLILQTQMLVGGGIFPVDKVDFFPNVGDQFEVQSVTEKIAVDSSNIQLRLLVKKFSTDWPKAINGVIAIGNSPQNSFEVTVPIVEQVASTFVASKNSATTPHNSPIESLFPMLLFAFVGGLLLNFMPCVLPVITLKILGFISQANENPRRVRQLGLVYAAGVWVSFLALADLVIAVKAAGHRASWGMQFGNPTVIVALAALVTLVALNLFGVFEVTLGSRVMDTAGKVSGGHGASGAFFNGVLATVLATPCTAPFLAPALGFAFTQSPATIVMFFSVIALGLATPYLMLSLQPVWLQFLPKPGAWMEKFKIAMGFPMLATAVWLYDVAAAFYGERTWWLGIFLVTLALAAWVYGEFVQRGRKKTFALAVTLILLGAGYVFALEKNLHWRTAVAEMPAVALKESADGIDWQPWSAAAVAQARAAGRPVLVDFTARWCSTCRVNKIIALEIPSVREKLKTSNGVALLADYTHFDEAIGAELARFNRAGVPLVLVYPADASQPPQVLPAVLTPQIVLNALNAAAK